MHALKKKFVCYLNSYMNIKHTPTNSSDFAIGNNICMSKTPIHMITLKGYSVLISITIRLSNKNEAHT